VGERGREPWWVLVDRKAMNDATVDFYLKYCVLRGLSTPTLFIVGGEDTTAYSLVVPYLRRVFTVSAIRNSQITKEKKFAMDGKSQFRSAFR
jgi:hypothetical protein